MRHLMNYREFSGVIDKSHSITIAAHYTCGYYRIWNFELLLTPATWFQFDYVEHEWQDIGWIVLGDLEGIPSTKPAFSDRISDAFLDLVVCIEDTLLDGIDEIDSALA